MVSASIANGNADQAGVLINVFESVDVITLISGGVYEDLNMTVGEVLLKRLDDFAGIHTCSPTNCRLDAIFFDTLRQVARSPLHRGRPPRAAQRRAGAERHSPVHSD